MKVALIHDHLAQDGGAERVLKVFQKMFPDAPTFVIVYDKKNADQWFKNKDIRTSFIQNLPLGISRYQWYLAAMPAAVESYDLSEYDLILSSSSSFAKGVITKPSAKHICYCHTPTRFLWSDTHEYVRDLKLPAPLRSLIKLTLPKIRLWDRLITERIDHFISNSSIVSERIQKYYNRESTVIHPPINIDAYATSIPQRFYLTGGRLVSYKRFDITVKAFNKLRLPLLIFGDGPELTKLKKMALKNIHFLGRIDEAYKKKLFATSRAFINPQEEDFGITMVESIASGRPVIAYNAGGAREIIEEHLNGLFFEHQSVESLVKCLEKFQHHYKNYTSERIRNSARRFDENLFIDQINDIVKQYTHSHEHTY